MAKEDGVKFNKNDAPCFGPDWLREGFVGVPGEMPNRKQTTQPLEACPPVGETVEDRSPGSTSEFTDSHLSNLSVGIAGVPRSRTERRDAGRCQVFVQ